MRVLIVLSCLFYFNVSLAYAQLFTGSDIRISNTGACSINIGINESKTLPNVFHCEYMDTEALDLIDQRLSELGWSEFTTNSLKFYLPNTWRMQQIENMYTALPRPATLHSEYSMQLDIEGSLRYGGFENYADWSTTVFGPKVIPNGVDYLSISDNEMLLVTRAHLFFTNLFERKLSGDGNISFNQTDVTSFLDDKSEIIRIAGFPYCEGDTYEENSAPVFFLSDTNAESGRINFSIFINNQVYFPKRHGYTNYFDDGGVKDRFSIFDVSNSPEMTVITCSGIETIAGDIYKICRPILSQIIIQNSGQLSC